MRKGATKLLPDIASHVRDAEPANFKEALVKALHVENLLEARKGARSSYQTVYLQFQRLRILVSSLTLCTR